MKFSDNCPILIVLILFASYGNSLDNLCGNNWHAFKDEKCFHILDEITRTFPEAEKACEKLENASTLPVIHSKEEQEFLSNFLFTISKKLENFWLGAKVVQNNNSKVAWIDNSELGYTNWDVRGPRNKPNYCVQMEADESVVGKWIDEPCEKKNLVVCQRMQTWSLEKLQKLVLKSKVELDEANKQIQNLKQILEEERIENRKNVNQIPIGFVYPQLPHEKAPAEIWPNFHWTDISATYAGVFFRVNGEGSEPFGGRNQPENFPRLTTVERYVDDDYHHTHINNVTLHSNGPSEWIYTGDNAKDGSFNYVIQLRFTISGGEVRPRNMSVKVWKRTG